MKRNYKIFCVFFIFIIFLNVFVGQSFAENIKNAIDVDVEKINKDEINVILKVSDVDYRIMGMQGTIVYDKEKLEIQDNEILKESMNLTGFNKEKGDFIIEINDENFYDEDTYLEKNDQIVKFSFKTKEKVSESDIKLENIKIFTSDYETIEIPNEESTSNSHVLLKIVIGIAIVLVIILIIKKLNRRGKFYGKKR